MKKLLLILTGIFFPLVISAQSLTNSRQTSYYTYIYQLKHEEAKNIYRKDLYVVDQSYFHTVADSFPTGKKYDKTLPYGHYLITYADGGDLVYELKSVNNLRLQLLNNKVDLSIHLTDFSGQPIDNAAIKIGEKPIPFHTKAGAYLLEKKGRKGVVSVSYQGFTSYHHIGPKNKLPFLRKIKNRIIYRRPVYWVWKPFRDVVRSIRYRYPEGWLRSVASIVNPDEFSDYTNKFRGYMAFNKPIYRPGDTVQFKAFILKRRGRPIGYDLSVVLNTSNGRKTLTTLHPYRKGGYEYRFLLHDSLQLQLDRNYGIALERRKYRTVMYDSFQLEEYELKSNTFTLRSDKAIHHSGTLIAVYAGGKDENELPVPDATLQLTVIPSQILHFTGKHIFVKDTLWQYFQKLDPIGETKIILPDSIFPALSVAYTVHAEFLNAGNERHTQVLNLTYIHQKQQIKIDLSKDTLIADYLVAGKSTPVEAQLTTWIKEEEKPVITFVTLPFKAVLNPYVYSYEYKVDSLTTSFFPAEEESLLQCYSHRTTDSLHIWVDNPRKIPFHYTIYRKNQAIERGSGSTLGFAAKVTTPAHYFISLQYVWAGRVQEKEFGVPFPKNKLNIAVNQPLVVSPGQQSKIDIVVTDSEGKPAKDVDLTAYALTDKFKNAAAPEIPYMGRNYKGRKARHEFELDNQFTSNPNVTYPLNWQYWNQEMGLDSLAYYQFLYPSKGLFTQYIFIPDSLALFAPFVIQYGRVQPVYLIYLDNRPVYYKDTDVEQRYAFHASNGYHSLKLRTQDKVITIDSVLLQPGNKLVLSVDANAVHKRIHIEEARNEYSPQEQLVLNRYVMHMLLPDKEAYLKQGNFIQPLTRRHQNRYYNHSYTFMTGIYMPSPMEFALRDGFTTSFTFEPLYIYEFKEQLLKMRSINSQNSYHYRLHPSYDHIKPDFSEQPYRQKEIDSLWAWRKEAELAKTSKFTYEKITTKGFGKLIVHQMALPDSAEKRIKAVLLFRKDEPNFLQVYPARTNTFHQLKPGAYKVVLLLYFNEFIETENFQVGPHGSTYITIKDLPVQPSNEFSRKAATMIHKEAYSLQQEKKNLQEVKESFYNTYNMAPTGDFTHLVSGQVSSSDGSPIPGVNVVVKGTATGTVTNAEGQYHLYVPVNGVLVFSFIGYMTEELLIGSKAVVDAQLQEDVQSLAEVVVVGYGQQKRYDLTGSVSTVTALQGRVAGVQVTDTLNIRGGSSLNTENPPFIIVNGTPFHGTLADIDPALITKTQVLKGEVAKALYGARASNGVILISTSSFALANKKDALATLSGISGDASAYQSIRNNFSDYAFWQPRLTTNKEGKASFSVTFPDDVTKWRTFVLAMDYHKRSGMAEGAVKSFKPVVSTLAVPRFLVQGDSSLVIGKTTNYTSDTLTLSTAFLLNGERTNAQAGKVIHSLIDSMQILAMDTDSMQVSYVSKQEGGEEDGERRYIPVFPKGTKETKGIFLHLDKDTTFTLNFDPKLGKVNVYVQGDMLQVLLNEIENIKRYEYYCNEQAASKLIALLLEKQIRTTLGEIFKHDRDIQKLINKLEAAQRRDGTWGWWPGSSPLMWVSLHVAEALLMAEKSGYRVSYNRQALQDHLIFELEHATTEDKLRCLHLLQTLHAKADYPRYTEALAKDTTLQLAEQLQLIEIMQAFRQPYTLDSLYKYKQTTLLGSMYIEKQLAKTNSHVTVNAVTNTVRAYRILKLKGGHEADLQAMRRYFLERKSSGYWTNTYESALILSTILPDLLTGGKLQAVALSLQGALEANIDTFPYQAGFMPGQPLTIRKTDKRPVYVTAYQQYWHAGPEKNEKDFVVRSYVEGNTSGLLQLKAGKPVKLVVEVEVKQDADYLMLEVPIPAGCSYEDKRTNYINEVHREHFKQKTSIFCQQLRKGKYEFIIHLLPRYNGLYTLNPAQAQLMYFPVFYGRNEVKKVRIQ